MLWRKVLVLAATSALATAAPRPLGESIRSGVVQSFKVMDVLAAATQMERDGHHICHLEVGQPQSGAPQKVLAASEELLRNNRIGYTQSLGIDALRKRIAQYYRDSFTDKDGQPLEVDESCIVITTGSSGGFLLSFIGAFDQGDVVAVASAGYPCYRNLLNALGCEVATVPINDEFKVTAKELSAFNKALAAQGKKLRGLILSSPSNPTGAMLTPEELEGLCEYCDKESIQFLSDEIYHHISYGKKEATALQYSKSALILNSFSKFYSMTGWRLGWIVVPKPLLPAINRLQQNFFISAPTLSQFAAVEAFDCKEELQAHVTKYKLNRDIILESLKDMGLTRFAPADGAFYIYVDVSGHVEDSEAFSREVLRTAHVALTPGTDFEDPSSGLGKKRIRLSYCGATEDIIEAMRRLKAFWKDYKARGGKKAAATAAFAPPKAPEAAKAPEPAAAK